YSTELLIEEGDIGQCEADGVVESTNAGFSGTGYLNSDNAVGASIEWVIAVGEAGTYSLAFTYASLDNRPADLLVGGMNVASGVSFPPTESWTTWSTATVELTLSAGENRIVLSAV